MSKRPAGSGRYLTFTPAAGASTICNVTIQVVDTRGQAVAGIFNILVWLSDAATGLGVTSTTASGTVTAKSSYGTLMGSITAKFCVLLQTLANGSVVLEITDSSKTLFYVAAAIPGGAQNGEICVSDKLATANYGA
jgi:hypothetical protein